jgi:hypothetical protein
MTDNSRNCCLSRNKSYFIQGIVDFLNGIIVKSPSLTNRLNTVLDAKMNTSNNLYRDIATGLLVTIGVFGFMSGEFVISTMLFGAASLSSNLDLDNATRP